MPLILFALLVLVGLTGRPSRPARMPMRHPRIAHFGSYLFSDSLKAIRRAKRLRYWGIDQNLTSDAEGVVWVNHWPKFWKGSWRWYWTGKLDKRGREVRVKAPFPRGRKIQTLTTAQVSRLRSAKRGGRRLYRPRTHMALCAQVGIVWCPETKNAPALLNRNTWDGLAKDAVETGATVVVMSMPTQGGHVATATRLGHAAAVGFPVAILPRGKRPDPATWARTYGKIPGGVAIWNRSGHW